MCIWNKVDATWLLYQRFAKAVVFFFRGVNPPLDATAGVNLEGRVERRIRPQVKSLLGINF